MRPAKIVDANHKLINALRDSGELVIQPGQDPIEALLAYYAARAYASSEKTPHKMSKDATKLAQVASISGLPIPEIAPPVPAQSSPPLAPAVPSRLVKLPAWKTVVK
jgi:hypothetical protein